jgi:putative aldouronate transport system permease protein
MALKQTPGERLFDAANLAFMLVMVAVTIYPMLHVLNASLSNPYRLMAHHGVLLKPAGLTLDSYAAVLRNPNIGSGYRNTLFVVVVGVAINIFMTSLGAYVLSRKRLMLKGILMFVTVFTMFFSGGLIPLYFTVQGFGIDDSLWALILPTSISTYNLIILRTAFLAIPDSMEESAKMDGASHFTILFRIMVPLAMHTIAVLILFYGVYHWNAWFHAMIFLRDRGLYPLQLILREILIQNDTNSMMRDTAASEHEMISETIKYAVIVVATVPILALYPFLQRYFVKGVMIGALKG